jgi:hypothetical protein
VRFEHRSFSVFRTFAEFQQSKWVRHPEVVNEAIARFLERR